MHERWALKWFLQFWTCDLASNTVIKLLSFFTFTCIYLSIYLSACLSIRFFSEVTGHSFGAIFTLNGSNDVISQPLVPFDGHINISSLLRESNPPKPQFWGRE